MACQPKAIGGVGGEGGGAKQARGQKQDGQHFKPPSSPAPSLADQALDSSHGGTSAFCCGNDTTHHQTRRLDAGQSGTPGTGRAIAGEASLDCALSTIPFALNRERLCVARP
jgi:hypothetical protein